jgi:hypothetical protein
MYTSKLEPLPPLEYTTWTSTLAYCLERWLITLELLNVGRLLALALWAHRN